MIDHDQAKAALDQYIQQQNNDVRASQDPNWLQTVGHIGQALNLLGVTGVTINRDAPNQPAPEQEIAPEPTASVSPLVWIIGGGVVVLVVALLLMKE